MKLKVGVIGAGYQGRIHLARYASLPEKVEIVAVSDAVNSTAEELARQYNAKAWYTDYNMLLKRSDVDAVSICVPNFLHSEVAVAAAEAGKHVLLEKPMACSLEEADNILRASSRAGVKLMIAYNQVFNPMIQHMKELIKNGQLGKTSIVKSQYVRNFLAGGISRGVDGWRTDIKRAGGGVLTEAGVHRLSLAWYLGGEVEKTSAFTSHLAMDIDGEDSAVILLAYRNGGLGVVICSWVAEFKGPEFERIEVYGTKGSVLGYGDTRSGIAHLEISSVDLPEYGRIHSYFPPGDIFRGGFDTYFEEFKHFLDCIDKDTTPIVDGHAGKAILEMTLAAYASARTQMAIKLPLQRTLK